MSDPGSTGAGAARGDVLAALVAGRPEAASRLVAEVLGPLRALPEAECALLLATLDAWLSADGSAAGAAARLGCHRNTVANRLRRLERATARSVTRPRDLAELTLALAALRLPPA
ncbi:helix-turn-helix domain-containing protein [Streptomyces sp. NPDC060194]|uniref:helix-turn-helix domain-containing protein n=1 Tax=Streptomyces sp. NPDC060194 TaxID=3347069 RepID=UPI00365455CF